MFLNKIRMKLFALNRIEGIVKNVVGSQCILLTFKKKNNLYF